MLFRHFWGFFCYQWHSVIPLVGIDLYLPDQLANAQRLLLKTAFTARGFQLDVRGMPLQRFYIYDNELEKTADSRNDNRNDYQLSLKFSPQIDSPRLKDRAVYKPGEKPPAPIPRMDLTIRPN